MTKLPLNVTATPVRGVAGRACIALAMAACAAPARSPLPAPSSAPSSVPVAPSLPSSALPPASPPLLGVYLPPARAAGSPYCVDPDSPALRGALRRWKADEPVAAPALADDVRDLHAAMKKLYAGYPELLQDPRFDVERFFAEWEARLRAAGPTVTFEEGVVRPLVVLRQVRRDNHLVVADWADRLIQRPELAVSEYQAHRRLSPAELEACSFPGTAPIDGTLRASRQLAESGYSDLATFSAPGQAEAVVARCGGQDVTFERRAPSPPQATGAEPPYEWRSVGDAAVIIVRRLYGSPGDEALLDKIALDYPKYRTHPTLVFDFRGDGGGNYKYIYDWIEKAVRGPWRAPFMDVEVAGAQRPCGDWNSLVLDQIIYGRLDDAAAKVERERYWKEALPELASMPAQAVQLNELNGQAKEPYKGKIFVLVDRDCASSAEKGPDMLRAALGAVIVGERTSGAVEVGDTRPYVMPRTGIVWEMATKRFYYPETREGVGLPVDVYLTPELLAKPVDALVPILERAGRASR